MWTPPRSRKSSAPSQQQYSPPPTYSQSVQYSTANRPRPMLNHLRSTTFDESDYKPPPLPEPRPDEQYTLSDGQQIHNWQSRRPVPPQSVPYKPAVYEFSLHGRDHHEAANRATPGVLSRAETVGSGLGAEHPSPENSGLPECTICFEEFSDEGSHVPLNLKCGHSYCTGCVEQLLSPATNPISCPKCKTLTYVEGGDISTLPKNFALMDVIHDSIKTNGYLSASAPPPRSSSPSLDRERSPVVMRCEEHDGDNLSSFCMKCGELVCSSCLLYGKHRDHYNKTMFVSKAASWYRQEFQKYIPEVNNQRRRMEAALGEVERMNDSVQETGGRLVREANDVYGELIGLIEARRDTLKLEIMKRTQLRVEALTDQAIDLKECLEKATAVQHTMTQLSRSDDFTLLQRATLAMDQMEGVFTNPPSSTPRAQNDLSCEFSGVPKEEIANNLSAYGSIKPIVGVTDHLFVKAYHDGFFIQWGGHDYIDNVGTTYYLQKATGNEEEYRSVYRGSATKYNLKEDLKQGEKYRFRVQVRTTEGLGNWSQPQEVVRAPPDFRWHESWRNVKVDLCRHRLEAAWTKGGSHNFWATFSGDRFFQSGKKYYFEIEILDLGKGKSLKKLAFGVTACKRGKPESLLWQDGKNPIGLCETPSWSFQPMLGVINSHSTPRDGLQYCSESKLQDGDRLGMLVDLINRSDGKISYFLNGRDLGVAFKGLEEESVLPCVSIRDKIRVLLRFPPPPYGNRQIKLNILTSMSGT